MMLFNWLLAANWLEQKSQGEKTRAATVAPVLLSPETSREIDQRLEKVRADSQSFSNWTGRQSLLTLMRMSLFGMTKKEETEALKAFRYECDFKFPR
jgi:hypothetical protein